MNDSDTDANSESETKPDADSEADTNPEADSEPVINRSDQTDLHFVVPADELGEGERVLIDVNEREVAVVRHDGDLHAFSNHCPHQGGPVGEGQLSGRFVLSEDGEGVSDLQYDDSDRIVSCPWHGWEFDLKSGDHISDPKYKLPQYEVVVRGGDVYLSMDGQ